MAEAQHIAGSRRAGAGNWPFAAYLAIVWLGIALFLALDLVDGGSFNGDTDDLLRALEIRRFLATGAWYDLSFPDVRMPEVYVAPWSRLVDLPYALIATGLAPLVGLEEGIRLSFLIWPCAMALLYGFAVVSILRRLAPAIAPLPVSLLLAVLLMSVYAIWEFSPGRIDHHNVQILLLLALVYGVCRWDGAGGAIAGAAVPASVAVGLETLPVLAVALLALVMAWIFDLRGARTMLRSTGIACAAAALLFALVQIPPAELLTAHNDAWSAPYVLSLMAFGLLSAAIPALSSPSATPMVRLFALGVPGTVALVMILVAYPGILAGPFPMISGLAKTYWFDRIHQERGALLFIETQDYRSILLFCAAAATVAATSIGALRRARDGNPVIAVLVAIAWAAVLVTLFSNRFLRITLAFVPLLLPVALGNLRIAFVQSRRWMTAATATIGCSIAAILSFSMLTPSRAASYDAFDQLIMNDCRLSDFSALTAIRPGRIITPPGLGLQILYRAVPGITVSSISFHRAAAAMSHALELYMTSDRERRKELLAGADYLAVCHSPVLLEGGEKLPLFRDLLAGVPVPGITEAARSGDLVIFKVDHGAL
jgi:hypothetical protein